MILKKALLAIAILGIGFSSSLFASDKVLDLTRPNFDALQVVEGGVTLNNFSLAEEDAFLAKGVKKVSVSFSVRNSNKETRALVVMLVGMAGTEILWAVDAEPMMTIVQANKTEQCEGSAYIPPGTVARTTHIWLRIVGNLE